MKFIGSTLLAGAVTLSALLAAVRSQTPVSTGVDETPAESFGAFANDSASERLPLDHPPVGLATALENSMDLPRDQASGELPPGHPPIGRTTPPEAREPLDPPGTAVAPAIVWSVPARWTKLPNPNTMRIATYHIPAAPGAPDEAELSVVQAGGTTAANFQRWLSQFVDAEPAQHTEKMVHGLKVSGLDVRGTFQAASMGSSEGATPRAKWSLKAAVVETAQGPYFFKLTGPTASVHAARGDFDALVDSVRRATSDSFTTAP